MKNILATLFILLTACTIAQTRYVCFQNDKNPKLFVSVKFNDSDRPFAVKYSGQKSYIAMKFKNRSDFRDGEGSNNWWNETYNEIINGRITGQYVITNAGTHGLDFQYYRKRDGKKFYFKIYEMPEQDENFPYTYQPLF